MSKAIVKEQPMTEAEAVKLAEDVVSGWVFDSTVMGVEQVKLGELKKTVAAALLAASRPGEGMIRTHEGKDLRLLGTLPVTADGCVAGEGARLWLNNPKITAYKGPVTCGMVTWQSDGPAACVETTACYSSASAAKGVGDA